MKKRLPIGIDDYKEIIENNYYHVDKTLFIQELYEQGGKITLIPRPRRFGKTLNLSMLRHFFEKTAEPTSHLFEHKKIWHLDQYRAMQGQYPVIFITFKDIKFTNFQETYNSLTSVIATEIKRHKASLHGIMDSYDEEHIDQLIRRTASIADFAGSLKLLSQLLAQAYKKNAFVLLDEYDTPIHAGYHHGFYEDVVNFIRNLLGSVFKGNTFLERGVITGIMRTAKEGIFSGLNNLEVYDVLDPQCADKFGFTDQDIDQLLTDYELSSIKENIKRWYNGYQFGKTTQNASVTIYNPWSVLNCIKNNGRLETYWVNTSDNAIIKELIAQADTTLKKELELLLADDPTPTAHHEIEKSIIFPAVKTSANDAVWSFLLFTGYVTVHDVVAVTQGLKIGLPSYALRIPNREITIMYANLIKESIYSIISNHVTQLLEALITGESFLVEKHLQKFIINSLSFHDIPSDEPERSYHLFILGLLVLLEGRYRLESNRESGLGRYDIMLIPANPAKDAGIVIEFKKKTEKKETVEQAAQRALEQIIDRQYAAQLKAHSCSTIYQYGVGFEGKELALIMEKV